MLNNTSSQTKTEKIELKRTLYDSLTKAGNRLRGTFSERIKKAGGISSLITSELLRNPITQMPSKTIQRDIVAKRNTRRI